MERQASEEKQKRSVLERKIRSNKEKRKFLLGVGISVIASIKMIKRSSYEDKRTMEFASENIFFDIDFVGREGPKMIFERNAREGICFTKRGVVGIVSVTQKLFVAIRIHFTNFDLCSIEIDREKIENDGKIRRNDLNWFIEGCVEVFVLF